MMDKRASGLAKMAAAVPPTTPPAQPAPAKTSFSDEWRRNNSDQEFLDWKAKVPWYSAVTRPLKSLGTTIGDRITPVQPYTEEGVKAWRLRRTQEEQGPGAPPAPALARSPSWQEKLKDDPASWHFFNDTVTRRQAWETSLNRTREPWQSAQRTAQILTAGQKYRATHPELYHGRYREVNPDYPFPVKHLPDAAIGSGRFIGVTSPLKNTFIERATHSDRDVLLHETGHSTNIDIARTIANTPEAAKKLQKQVINPLYRAGTAAGTGTADDYLLWELPSVSMNIRAEMENHGIDTTDPQAIQATLMGGMGNRKDAGVYLRWLYRILQELPEADRMARIKELSEILPGYSATDRNVADMGKRASGLMKMAAYTESTTPW